jgi:hypothetical protein
MKVNDPKRLAGGYKASYAGQGTFQNEQQAKSAGADLSPRPKPANATAGPAGKTLYDTGGKLPTLEQFTSKGQWLLRNDPGAKDYGRKFGPGDAQYYANFKKKAEAALAAGNQGLYNEILRTHGFGANKPAPEPEKRRSALTAEPAAPKTDFRPEFDDYEIEDITPPASGLEDTIKTSPQLLRERRRRSYLTRG